MTKIDATPPWNGTCWVVTDGKPGMENQCLGLAAALGIAPEVKRIALRWPWRHLTPHLWFAPRRALSAQGDLLAPPWPDLLICSGRPTVALSRAIRRASAGRTFTVQIQNPTVALRDFDLVVTPAHDRVTGPNVIATQGGLHGVTAATLAAEAAKFAPTLAHLPQPRVAVLIGGSNKCYRLTSAGTARLAASLADMARAHGAGLMVTPSRRTGADNERILRDGLRDVAAVIWDGSGDNPYFAYLGHADFIVVTGDSVNMVSEACATGKPVYVVDLEGPGSAKFRRFHQNLRAADMTHPFTGRLESWDHPPLDDMARVSTELRRRLAARRGQKQPSD